MAERRVSQTVEMKAGEHEVIELGGLEAGDIVKGFVKEADHDNFLFVIVDEANSRRFMESEEEAKEEEEELRAVAEGDGKGHYRIEVEIEAPGKYFLIVESEAAATKRTVRAELQISGAG